MFGLGPLEITLIIVVILIFGAKRMPDVGSGLGKGIKNFKKSLSDTEKEKLPADTDNDKEEEKED